MTPTTAPRPAPRAHFEAALAELRRADGLLTLPFTAAKKALAVARLERAQAELNAARLGFGFTAVDDDPLLAAANVVPLRARSAP